MSLHKRKSSPYWQSDIIIKGHRFTRSTGKVSRREAEAWERRFRDEKRQELERSPAIQRATELTVDEMFGRYWKEHGSGLRWAANVAAYSKRIVALIGPLKVAQLTLVDCAALFEDLKQEGMGKVSRNRALSVLRAAHRRAGTRWGCPIQLIEWRDLRNPEAQERVRFLTREEAGRLVGNCPEHIALIVEWSLYTGLRKRETVGLMREAFDPARGSVEVVVKGGKKRVIQLSPAALDVLARAPSLPMGRIFDATNLRKHFLRACAKTGLRDFHFHDLRHTFATWLRQGGAAIEIVSRALGHSSIVVTQKYAHVDDKEVLAATGSIGVLTMSNVVHLGGRARGAKSRTSVKNAGG